MGARVVAVADALDAMTSDRPYRQALSLDEALARFRAGAGSSWDPVVVKAMLGLVEGGRLGLDASRLADEAGSDGGAGEPGDDRLGLDTGRDAA
jgi:HD-GYP domain-containing protein (c-di-GMP phosphodiesterase class II)